MNRKINQHFQTLDTFKFKTVLQYNKYVLWFIFQVVVQVTPILSPAQPFPIGREVITYTATDPAGNKANCSFTVTVIGVSYFPNR